MLKIVTGDLSIISLSFSTDGLYLAALGDLPEQQITIWDWRAQKQIISVQNGSPADFISFNPLDSKQLCTSGKNGQIRFWNLKIGFKTNTITSIMGATSSNQTFEEPNKIQLNPWQLDMNEILFADREVPTPYQHMWIPNRKVLCTNREGNEILKYDSDKGLYDIFMKVGEDRKLISIIQTSKHFYVAGLGGQISILNLQGNELRSLKVPDDVEIIGLQNSPDYQRVLVEVTNGKFYLCDFKRMQSVLISIENVNCVTDVAMLASEKTMVSSHSDGTVSFWIPEKGTQFQKINIDCKITCLGVSHTSSVLAVGSSTGVVRLYNAKDLSYRKPKLLFRRRTHKSAVLKVISS